MQQKLTLIIPTKNRSVYLNKLFEYYSFVSFIEFIILDSSNNIERKKNLKLINKYKNNFKIKYYYEKLFPTAFLSKYISKINSKYVIMCADDDFFIIKSLKQGCKYLDKNQKYSILQGKSLKIELLKYVKFVRNYWEYYKFENNNSELRLIRHLENYKPINFSIIRTSLIKKIMKFYPSSKIDYLCPVRGISDEYLVSSLMVFSSKIKVINNLFLVRIIHGNSYKIKNSNDLKSLDISINFFIKSINKYSEKIYDKQISEILEYKLRNILLKKFLNNKNKKEKPYLYKLRQISFIQYCLSFKNRYKNIEINNFLKNNPKFKKDIFNILNYI